MPGIILSPKQLLTFPNLDLKVTVPEFNAFTEAAEASVSNAANHQAQAHMAAARGFAADHEAQRGQIGRDVAAGQRAGESM